MHYFVSVVYGLFSTVLCRIDSVVRVRLGEQVDLSCRVNNLEDNTIVSMFMLLYPRLYAHRFGYSNCRIRPNKRFSQRIQV